MVHAENGGGINSRTDISFGVNESINVGSRRGIRAIARPNACSVRAKREKRKEKKGKGGKKGRKRRITRVARILVDRYKYGKMQSNAGRVRVPARTHAHMRARACNSDVPAFLRAYTRRRLNAENSFSHAREEASAWVDVRRRTPRVCIYLYFIFILYVYFFQSYFPRIFHWENYLVGLIKILIENKCELEFFY